MLLLCSSFLTLKVFADYDDWNDVQGQRPNLDDFQKKAHLDKGHFGKVIFITFASQQI